MTDTHIVVCGIRAGYSEKSLSSKYMLDCTDPCCGSALGTPPAGAGCGVLPGRWERGGRGSLCHSSHLRHKTPEPESRTHR